MHLFHTCTKRTSLALDSLLSNENMVEASDRIKKNLSLSASIDFIRHSLGLVEESDFAIVRKLTIFRYLMRTLPFAERVNELAAESRGGNAVSEEANFSQVLLTGRRRRERVRSNLCFGAISHDR